jgi:(p)ppGpp synthase/HD superfamily hydrolase
MATLERAIALAACKHEGQRDKEGQPYILHCLRAMMRVEGEEAQIAAVLHDVVEDTSTTTDDLRREGFSERIIAAVEVLTHRHGDTYAEYVIRIAGNELARRVKLADLHDNTRLERAILRHLMGDA